MSMRPADKEILTEKERKGRARSRTRIAVGVVLLALVLLFVFLVNAGDWLVVDDPQPADVLVVLAGDPKHRSDRALELLRQGYGPKVVIDVPTAGNLYGFTHLELAEKYYGRLPEAAAIHICPIEGLSTKDETDDVRRCLAGQSGKRILLVTSDYHTVRALRIFQKEMPDKIFSIAAAHDPAQFGTQWWTHRQWAKMCFDEWLRRFWWTAVDRWR
jgi:hypothetical protein